ncbi:flagellar protein FlaG [Cupriavidus necator]|uniref:flagellar protein FlaG n=1 Tax=Cupriavidus necator TaxID=106590 RepID=UPI0005B4595E|nr:flagellar protein FlaG [Cupriavidus necator]
MATAATPSSVLPPALANQPAGRQDRRVPGMPAGEAAQAAPETSAANGKPPLPSLDAALERLTEALRTASVSVQFEIESSSHRVITKVMDKASGEVIRQIPTEELLRISDAMTQLQGLFVNQTA